MLAAKIVHDDQVTRTLSTLGASGLTVAEFTLAPPSLDEVFFALTGRPAEPEASDAEAAP